jgi:DNA-binding NarL/FixJ family response regulator
MLKSRDEMCGEVAPTHSARRANDRNSRDLVQSIPSKPVVDQANIATIVLIEKRPLYRECLTRCLTLACAQNVISFASVDGWLDVAENIPAALIVFCSGSEPNDAQAHREVSLLLQSANGLATILVSDVEAPDQIIDALDRGARGYIPTSVSLEVAIEAMHLVRAGGMFVPAESLKVARQLADSFLPSKHTGMFTARQVAVLEALRRGKANKIIAHELNMCESTVKLHIRNIMKKVGARNRTEVAFMTNGVIHSDHR